jgi:hypothetical protein
LLSMEGEEGTGDRVEGAKHLMSKLMNERRDELWPDDAAPSWLLGEEAVTQLQEWAKETLGKSEFTGFYQTVLQFQAGELGEDAEEKLLEAAGDRARYLGEAYYYIGLRRLSVGRQDAWQSFQESVDKGRILWAGWHESRDFLFLHKRDPSWPGWLPSAPVDAEAK